MPTGYLAVLQTQISILDKERKSPDKEAGLDKAIVFASARDAMRQSIPSDSELAKLVAKSCTRDLTKAQRGVWTPEDEEEFQTITTVARLTDTETTANLPNTADTVQTQLEYILPSLILKSKAFQFVLAALFTTVLFAFFGTIKFQGLEYDVKKTIQDKELELVARADRHRITLEALERELKQTTELIALSRSDAQARLTEVKTRIDQIESGADSVLAQFKRDVERKYGPRADGAIAEVERDIRLRLKEANGRIDEKTKDALNELGTRAGEKASLIMREDRPEFKKTLDALQRDIASEAANLKSFRSDLAALKSDIGTLSSKAALVMKALAALAPKSQNQADRLASYFSEALWVVYGAAGLLLVMSLLSTFIFVSAWRKRAG